MNPLLLFFERPFLRRQRLPSASHASLNVTQRIEAEFNADGESMKADLPRIVTITQYSLPENKRNMNAYQRVLHGARFAHVKLIIRREAEVSQELERLVQVHRAPVNHRWLFLVYSILLCIILRFQSYSCILTEPSGFAAVGFAAKYLAGYRWALDVWDRPRWRTGQHEDGSQPTRSDRVVFWVMRHADVFLMSVLPRAARDIKPDPKRCIQLCNAIDLSLAAKEPPRRYPAGDATLHLAYGRSKFWDTMGLDVVIRAAEKLQDRGCPVLIHLIGELPDSERRQIEASLAGCRFTLHGFTKHSRIELFRTVHAGLVPYLPYEDLSYIFPIKALEHLSQGNPVIATNLPGLATLIKHEQNGLLVKPGDSEDLASAIERLQKDCDLFNRLAANALASIRQFDVEAKNRQIFETILRR